MCTRSPRVEVHAVLRSNTGREVIERRAEREHVARLGHRAAGSGDLRSSISRGPATVLVVHDGAAGAVPKRIPHLEVPVTGHHQVVGLDVAVDHIVLMHRRDALTDLFSGSTKLL